MPCLDLALWVDDDDEDDDDEEEEEVDAVEGFVVAEAPGIESLSYTTVVV